MRVHVDTRFVADFNLCLEHYGCDKEEAQYEKQRCLENYEEACKCYSIIAAGIRSILIT